MIKKIKIQIEVEIIHEKQNLNKNTFLNNLPHFSYFIS